MLRVIAFLLLLLSVPALASDALEIGDPWSPEAPPGRMMAGFMTLANHGSDEIVLVDAASEQFGRVEIHTMTVDDDDMMRMRKIDELAVPPGETVHLESGGLHLMLIDPEAHFSAGDRLDIELIAADGQRFELSLEVRSR